MLILISHELEMQAEVVEAFRKRFQLRAEEIAALRESHVGNLHKVCLLVTTLLHESYEA